METAQMQVLEADGASAEALDEREIVVTRLIEAPRELVWKAWTQAEHVAAWWGPECFTNTVHEMEVKPGGRWRYTMHSPGGEDYPNLVVFQEVVEPERLVYTHGTEIEGRERHFRVRVDFEEQGDQTFLSMRMMFATLADREEMAKRGAVEGINSTLNGLQDYVARLASKAGRALEFSTQGEREIVMRRSFEASRELVFEAWTKPEHLTRWMLGPEGWSLPICEIDLRVGGAWHFVWRSSEGGEMEMRGVYQEIEPPERIVCTENWGGDWPETLQTIVLSHQAGVTTMTTTLLFPSPEARDRVLQTGMQEGVGLSYERLEELLAALS